MTFTDSFFLKIKCISILYILLYTLNYLIKEKVSIQKLCSILSNVSRQNEE